MFYWLHSFVDVTTTTLHEKVECYSWVRDNVYIWYVIEERRWRIEVMEQRPNESMCVSRSYERKYCVDRD